MFKNCTKRTIRSFFFLMFKLRKFMNSISVYFHWKFVTQTNKKKWLYLERKKNIFQKIQCSKKKYYPVRGSRRINIKTNVWPRYMLCLRSACSRRPRGHVRQGRTNERPRTTTLTACAASNPRTSYSLCVSSAFFDLEHLC